MNGLARLSTPDKHFNYCEQTLGEEQHLFKCIYSMMPMIQINILLYQMETDKNRMGEKRERGRERKRDAY